MKSGPKQTPNRRCGFCGEGITCEHGYCEVCQPCFECDMSLNEDQRAPQGGQEGTREKK